MSYVCRVKYGHSERITRKPDSGASKRRCNFLLGDHTLGAGDNHIRGSRNENHKPPPKGSMTDEIIRQDSSAISVPTERIERSIFLIRGLKVMLDRDLAQLYQVETRALLQAVKRNLDRFPPDFMFQLTRDEYQDLRSQSVISSWGGRRYLTFAFTEQGVAMLSSVLRGMRAFVRLRRLAASNADLRRKLDELEKKYDAQFSAVFDAIRQLMEPAPIPPKRRIGFSTTEE